MQRTVYLKAFIFLWIIISSYLGVTGFLKKEDANNRELFIMSSSLKSSEVEKMKILNKQGDFLFVENSANKVIDYVVSSLLNADKSSPSAHSGSIARGELHIYLKNKNILKYAFSIHKRDLDHIFLTSIDKNIRSAYRLRVRGVGKYFVNFLKIIKTRNSE